jgi:hypothetical protein
MEQNISKKQNIPKKYYKYIQLILDHKYRPYLSVFKLDNNTSLTDTIFLAIYTGLNSQRNIFFNIYF